MSIKMAPRMVRTLDLLLGSAVASLCALGALFSALAVVSADAIGAALAPWLIGALAALAALVVGGALAPWTALAILAAVAPGGRLLPGALVAAFAGGAAVAVGA